MRTKIIRTMVFIIFTISAISFLASFNEPQIENTLIMQATTGSLTALSAFILYTTRRKKSK